MLAYREDVLSALEEWEVLDPRLRELDSGAVAGTWRFRARGRESGILIDMRIGGVAEFREGRISKLESYATAAEAVAAAGLPEDAL